MSMSDSQELFSRVTELLLRGAFICEYSDEDAFKYLSEPPYAEAVDRHVGQLGRTVTRTSDGQAYFLVFVDVNTSARRQAIRKEFKDAVNLLQPMVRWLELVRSARQDDAPISPGDQLRQGDLLVRIENTPALREDLAMLTRSEFFKTSKSSTRDQLSSMLDKLVDQGFLLRNTPTGSEYTALGRWSFLYDLLEFTVTHEQIDDGEITPSQESLV